MVAVQQRRNTSSAEGSKKRDIGILTIGVVIGLTIAVMFRIGPDSNMLAACLMDSANIIDQSKEDSMSPVALRASTKAEDGSSSQNKQFPKFVPDGMNPIYSYWGKLNHITDPIPTTWWLETSEKHKENKQGSWFSQHGQDVAVAKFLNFKRDGYFVDLAANDAVWASNTFSLEQNFGWNGICIEANPQYWYRLSFRNCHVVGGIVGGANNEEVDVVLGQAHQGPYGGIVGSEFDNKEAPKKKENALKRYTVSLETILDMFNAPRVIDYLSLDVEGAELFIMKDFPFHKYQFKCMTVERPKDELVDIFLKNGYKKVLDIKRGDTLWAHESVYDEGKPLTEIYPEEIESHKVSKTNMPGFS